MYIDVCIFLVCFICIGVRVVSNVCSGFCCLSLVVYIDAQRVVPLVSKDSTEPLQSWDSEVKPGGRLPASFELVTLLRGSLPCLLLMFRYHCTHINLSTCSSNSLPLLPVTHPLFYLSCQDILPCIRASCDRSLSTWQDCFSHWPDFRAIDEDEPNTGVENLASFVSVGYSFCKCGSKFSAIFVILQLLSSSLNAQHPLQTPTKSLK